MVEECADADVGDGDRRSREQSRFEGHDVAGNEQGRPTDPGDEKHHPPPAAQHDPEEQQYGEHARRNATNRAVVPGAGPECSSALILRRWGCPNPDNTARAVRLRSTPITRQSDDVHAIVELDHREPAVADEIVRVQRAAYRVEADLIGFEGIPPLHETVGAVVALDLTVSGVRDETGLLVGLLGYSRDGDRVTIDRLAIDPARHRQGIARSLLEDLHRREHVESFEVSTGAANTPALRLYQQLGYRSIRRDRLAEGITVERLARAGRNPR